MWVRGRVEDISAKTQASSVNPLKNSCYLVGILCLNSPTGLGGEVVPHSHIKLGLGLGLGLVCCSADV